MKFFDKVYSIVQKIPRGKVITYGQIAKKLQTRNARLIGFALNKNPNNKKTPCHRVVFADGSLAPGFIFGGPKKQKKLLQVEGVKFENNKVLREHFCK
ncbi:MGMT family protein [Candidatus Woesearchaeota archaeon]|nr:MGMT family protein [Candidatus Woesearchaeota archaeon]